MFVGLKVKTKWERVQLQIERGGPMGNKQWQKRNFSHGLDLGLTGLTIQLNGRWERRNLRWGLCLSVDVLIMMLPFTEVLHQVGVRRCRPGVRQFECHEPSRLSCSGTMEPVSEVKGVVVDAHRNLGGHQQTSKAFLKHPCLIGSLCDPDGTEGQRFSEDPVSVLRHL